MKTLLLAAACALGSISAAPAMAASVCDGVSWPNVCGVPNYSRGEGGNGCHEFQINLAGPTYFLYSGEPSFLSSRNKLDMATASGIPITFSTSTPAPSGAGACQGVGLTYVRQISIGHKY